MQKVMGIFRRVIRTDETIKSPAKKVNAPLIEKYTGVKDYKGKATQIDELMKYVTDDNYDVMRKNISNAISDEKLVGSTNFNKLINYLDSMDSTWIATLNQVLE